MADFDRIRVGDPERQRAVELLGEAMAAGYLTVDEFDTRTHAAYAASNRGELRELLSDLPIRDRLFPVTALESSSELPVEVLEIDWTSEARKGVWTVPARMRITGSAGGAKLDFRRADFPYGGLDLELQVSWSTIKLHLGPTMRVDDSAMEYTGWSSMKDKAGATDSTSGPLLVLRGYASAGSGIVVLR
ncbi:hypothetical protein GCM10027289_22180 [Tsukamurella serpentis]